jgi:NitT/TauT family transport system substrate-binding protein
MRRSRFLVSLVGAALAGCARKSSSPRKLRVGLIPRLTMAPLYLADELGFFREAGLEVEFQQFQESPQTLTALAGGKLEVGFTTPIPVFINAVLKGARLKIVAGRDIAAPGCGTGGAIFGNRRAFPQGLRDLRLLKGKRVAISNQTGLAAFYLDQLLESAGMTTAEVKPVILRLPNAAAALIGGKIDAVVAVNLDKDLDVVSASVVRSTTLSELLPNFQYSFVVFGPALLTGDPGIGVSFLEAYLRGVREFRSGKTPRALEELARAAHSDPAAVRAACRENVSRDGMVDRASVQRFVDWAAKKGFVPRAVDASQLIETRFVEEAFRRLGGRGGSTG